MNQGDPLTRWEYARLEYRATGSFGADRLMDWQATFHHPGGARRWGTDEHFDDLRHLNRAGAAGWQAYDRHAVLIGQPLRLQAVTYSMRRPGPGGGDRMSDSPVTA
jgi:hypothetical protein